MSYNILAPGNNGLVLGTANSDFTVQSSGIVLVTTGNLDQVLYFSRNSESDKTQNSFTFDLTENNSSFIVSGILGTIGTLYVTGDIEASGNLSIDGTSTFEKDITVNANVIAENVITTSDKRLKTNIVNFTDQADIHTFRPVEFNWKKSPDGKKMLGFIAQEVQKNNPDMVYEDYKGSLGIDYIQFIAVLTKNVQELHKQVQKQQEQINKLLEKFT